MTMTKPSANAYKPGQWDHVQTSPDAKICDEHVGARLVAAALGAGANLLRDRSLKGAIVGAVACVVARELAVAVVDGDPNRPFYDRFDAMPSAVPPSYTHAADSYR